jgi:hypothetical protein
MAGHGASRGRKGARRPEGQRADDSRKETIHVSKGRFVALDNSGALLLVNLPHSARSPPPCTVPPYILQILTVPMIPLIP